MRAQISIEFMVFVGLTLVIAIAFGLSSAGQLNEFREKKESDAVKDLALKMQRELLIASHVEDGYFRQFELPNQAGGKNYTITSTNTGLSIESENGYYFVFIPSIDGNLTNGTNRINKTSGVIHVNK